MTTQAQPASRVYILSTASLIVGVMAALLPLMNERVEVRSVLATGWIPAWLAAHVGWAAHVGAIRERFVNWGLRSRQRDDAFAVALINPRVLTATEHPSRFRTYLLGELAITGLIWLALIGPAVFPFFMRISHALGLDAID